jgi:hypothetical protein
VELAMMVMAPFIKPDMPRPATTRPTINMVEDVATPHMRDPSSNRAKNDKKVYWDKAVRHGKARHSVRWLSITDLVVEIGIQLSGQGLESSATKQGDKLSVPISVAGFLLDPYMDVMETYPAN